MVTPTRRAHLRHIGIRTADMPGTATFYEHVFGLTRLRDDPSGSIVIGDGVINVTIVPLVSQASLVAEEGDEPIHLGFIVDDLVGTFRRCQEHGARILAGDVSTREPLAGAEVPMRSFKVADPNGYVIDVMGDPDHWLGVRI